MASTPGRPSKNAKDRDQAERDAERRAKHERRNRGSISSRTIADAAEAANRRGRAETKAAIEAEKERKAREQARKDARKRR